MLYSSVLIPFNLESDILTYEEYVIKNSKKFKSELIGICNVCYEENKDIEKCAVCIFCICEECFITIKKIYCVHCKTKF